MSETIHLKTSSGPVDADAKMETKLNSLLQLLESGEITSLNDLQKRLERPAEKPLIKCAALLQSFDEELYTNVLEVYLSKDVPRISFAEFTRHADIETVPRTEGVFRVKDAVRQSYLSEWQKEREATGPQALATTLFFQKLVSHYRSDPQRYEVDLLGLLILIDPPLAQERFLSLFDEADKYFDLARCEDLVKMLESRALLLSPELRDISQAKRQYVKARTLSAPDYYHTVFYYSRKSAVKAFDDLLKASPSRAEQWVFHLHAIGGAGKTMFVKWLISRHCVPAPRMIPVARLDFDFLHLPTVGRHPWLVILAIADQLNQQIAGSPLNEHLSSYWQFVSLLRSPDALPLDDSRADKEKLLQSIEAQARDIIVLRFIDALKESNVQRPFVVVFDTLEEMALHHKQSLIAILKQLRALHEGFPQMRLLLSGRYDLKERLTEFKTQFKGETIDHELPPFSAEEARAYLSETRRLENQAVIEAIIQKCERGSDPSRRGSNPFKLSLFADLYQQKEVQTAKEILSYPRTDFAYLINRVIKRIKEPAVQWLLRYAVIPRRLTFAFFEQVLASHLEEELVKKRKLDLVNQKYPKEAASFEGQQSWKESGAKRARSLDVRATWNQMRKYASGYSFISFDAGADSSPHLQPDVVVPMRLLLERQEIFKLLHQDAATYFERKAATEADPEQWAQHISEAIYHHFQGEGPKAAEFWRKQIAARQSQQDPAIRKMIAAELTRSDYVDEAGLPILRNDEQPLVNPADLYEAHSRVAEAAAATTAGPNERSAEWASVCEHLVALQQLRKKKVRKPEAYDEPFDARLLLRLALMMREVKPVGKEPIALLNEAVESGTSEQVRLSLGIQLAQALQAQKENSALQHFQRALKLAQKMRYAHVKSNEILLQIAQWHHEAKDYLSAEREYAAVLSAAKRETNATLAERVMYSMVELNLEIGRYDDAVRLIENANRKTVKTRTSDLLNPTLILGEVQARALFEPLRALSGIAPLLNESVAVKSVRERAAIAEIHGDVLGQLMNFDDALSLLEQAKEYWTAAADPTGPDRARMFRIEMQLFDIGNFNEAAYLMDVWERNGSKIDLELTCHMQVLRVLWAHRSGNTGQARQEWRKMRNQRNIRQSPRAYVTVLAAGLALNLADQTTTRQLIAELKKISPASARLPLLTTFQYADSPFDATLAERQALKRLLDVEPKGKDIIIHALFRADVFGRCGEMTQAQLILEHASRKALRQKNSFAYRHILLAKDRLGLPFANREVLFASGFLRDFANYPNLCGAGCIEQAERHLKRGETAMARRAQKLAQKYFTDAGTTTQWPARLSELSGEIALRDGQMDAARNHFNAALSIYEQLGNKPAATRMREILPPVNPLMAGNDGLLTVRMAATARTLVVSSYAGDMLRSERKLLPSKSDFTVREVMADLKDQSALYAFAKMCLNQRHKTESALGKLLFADELVKQSREIESKSQPFDFRIDSLAPSLGKIPWELARQDKMPLISRVRYFYRSTSFASRKLEATRWLQIALRHFIDPTLIIDGILAAKTLFALNIFKKEHNLPADLSDSALYARIGKLFMLEKDKPRIRIQLISSPHAEQVEVQRGLSFSSPPLEQNYDTPAFDTQLVWSSHLSGFKDYLRTFEPSAIHIQSSFRVAPNTGQIYLDFGYARDSYSSHISAASLSPDTFSPAFLNDALAMLPDTTLRPLIILDAISPPGETETIHQLLYRNAFATELFQLGNTSGVVAMGLAKQLGLYVMVLNSLIADLAHGQTYGNIVNSLRHVLPGDLLDEKIPSQGIALFTNEPSLTLLPL